jgi:NIMA (never in mitosis gene a)-related kinase 1/4/5
MASLAPPFRASNMDLLYKKVLSGQYPPIPTQYSSELTSLIASMLQVIPQKRPSCDQLLQHSKVQQVTLSLKDQLKWDHPLSDDP